jgi:hypothetical protein
VCSAFVLEGKKHVEVDVGFRERRLGGREERKVWGWGNKGNV